ncbi:MAG: hypothetical protein K6E38_00445 [Fretibacterium sp.]|nr:hypothetical protein [Fretibacterium sp.]
MSRNGVVLLFFLIKFLVRSLSFLAALTVAAAAGLVWLPTGSLLQLAVGHFGGEMIPRVSVGTIDGSVWGGYVLRDLSLVSGDVTFLTLDRAAVSPDWDLLMEGSPWLKAVEVEGFSADVARLQTLAEHFGSKEEEEKEPSSFQITPHPLQISVRDIHLTAPQGVFDLFSLYLEKDGRLTLRARVEDARSGAVLPLDADLQLGFAPLELVSSDLRIGKGQISLSGVLEPPFDFQGNLTAFPIETIMAFVPDSPVQASGRVDGRVSLKGKDASELRASGVISVPRSVINDIPLSFRLPWTWDGRTFLLQEAALKTKAAVLSLTASADLEAGRVMARGDARNLSLGEIGRIAAPKAGLAGEGGQIHFDVSAGLDGDLEKIAGEFRARLPEVSAAGVRLVRGLDAGFVLDPGKAPRLSCSGEVFGGKLFGRAAMPQTEKGVRPEAVFSLVNIDLATLGAAFPAAAEARPSGRVSLTARVAGDLSVTGSLSSEKLSAAGVVLQKLAADFSYKNEAASGRVTLDRCLASGLTVHGLAARLSYRNGLAALESLTGRLAPRALISASGTADVNRQTLNFRAGIQNINPRDIPQLRDTQFRGICSLEATAEGPFSSPRAAVRLMGRNNRVANLSLGNLDVSVQYADNRVTVSETRIRLPGGGVTLGGSVALGGAEPSLDASVSAGKLNLAQISQALGLKTPVRGTVEGYVNVKGPLHAAKVAAHLRADDVRTGQRPPAGRGEIRVPYVVLDARGDMEHIRLDRLEAKVGGALISGHGSFTAGKKRLMDSSVNLGLVVKGLELRPLLIQFMDKPPVQGVLDGTLALTGTLAEPALSAKVTSPLAVNKMTVDSLALKVTAPAPEHYKLSASGRMQDFVLAVDGDLQRRGGKWAYSAVTRPVNVEKLAGVLAPEAKGLVAGEATVRVKGAAPGTAPIDIRLSMPRLTAIGKVVVQDISVPVSVLPASGRIHVKDARAVLCGGVIRSGVDVDLTESTWKGSVTLRNLDMGRLAAPFLPEGELVGSADATVDMKGSFGLFPTSYASGTLNTSSGYLHKMSMLAKVTPTKRLSFENIRSTFFWNGRDLFINPGTQVTAGPDEPLYRYFSVNGSMGIPGKGLKLLFRGRFDMKLLDQFLGAMKGAFQYMTGALTGGGAGGFLRDAAGRILGIKKRDYQDVSFTLANSWQELRLLDLKTTKSIQDFLPIERLNREEQQKDSKQFKLRLRIPTGPGSQDPEDTSTGDQFKEQLIDNLFSIGS